MARHEVVIHENTGALAATAPYTGSYISKETLRMSAFATAIGGKCGLPAIQVMAILSGAVNVESSLFAVPTNQTFCGINNLPLIRFLGSFGSLVGTKSIFHSFTSGISITDKNSAK